MFKTRPRADVIRSAIADLASNASIANLAPGSKARAIVEALGSVIGNVSSDLSLGMINTLLPNAQGPVLDLLADMVGIQRLPEIRARVESGDANLKYYVKTGTFGDINNGMNTANTTATMASHIIPASMTALRTISLAKKPTMGGTPAIENITRPIIAA